MSLSAMQLSRFVLEELSLCTNEAFDPSCKTQHGNIEVSPRVTEDQGGLSRQLGLTISVGPSEDNEDAFPYEITARGRGHFTFSEDLPSEEVESMLLFNGSAMLLGLLRGQVAQITAMAEHGSILVPTLNLLDLFDASSEEEGQTDT